MYKTIELRYIMTNAAYLCIIPQSEGLPPSPLSYTEISTLFLIN